MERKEGRRGDSGWGLCPCLNVEGLYEKSPREIHLQMIWGNWALVGRCLKLVENPGNGVRVLSEKIFVLFSFRNYGNSNNGPHY